MEKKELEEIELIKMDVHNEVSRVQAIQGYLKKGQLDLAQNELNAVENNLIEIQRKLSVMYHR